MSVDANPFVRRSAPASRGPDGLADVLERILDKGLVVAGDIQINLLDIELITIKVRLLLASADTAQQMGIDWWKHDPFLSGRDRELAQENAVLRERVDALEAALGRKLVPGEPSPGDLVGEGAEQVPTRGQLRPTRETGGNGSRDAGAPRAAEDVREVVVDELILEHAGGGPAFRVTPAAEEPAAQETPPTQETPPDEEAPPVDDGEAAWLDEATIDAMTRDELRAELAARELYTSGTKDILRGRLLEALDEEWVDGGAADDGTDDDTDGG